MQLTTHDRRSQYDPAGVETWSRRRTGYPWTLWRRTRAAAAGTAAAVVADTNMGEGDGGGGEGNRPAREPTRTVRDASATSSIRTRTECWCWRPVLNRHSLKRFFEHRQIADCSRLETDDLVISFVRWREWFRLVVRGFCYNVIMMERMFTFLSGTVQRKQILKESTSSSCYCYIFTEYKLKKIGPGISTCSES